MRALFKLFGLVCSVMLLVALWPADAHGEDRSFEITNVEIRARIDRDGNMHVTEYDTYRFSGQFNGILVNLNSRTSDGIEHFQAYEMNGRQEKALEYDVSSSGTVHEYRIYAKSENETKTFKLTYTFKNVVQVYADIAELYWKFFDETNPAAMESVVIDIELPGDPGSNPVWHFGHGTTGSVNRLDNHIIRYEVKSLPSGRMLETRVLFPTWLVPGSTKIKQEPMLENILAEEEKWAAEDEGFDFSLIGALVLLVGNLAWGITVVRKYNRRFPGDWKGDYYRELPSDATPAVVSFLMNFRVEPRDLMATLIDLVRKKHVSVEKQKKPSGKKKEDFVFRLKRQDREELQPHEQSLVEWLFDELGNNGLLSLADLKKTAKETKSAKAFRKRWEEWQKEVQNAAKERGYVLVREKTVYTWMLLATVLQIFVIFRFLPDSWNWTFLCVLPLPFFKPKRYRRTVLGSNEYNKWNAFKRFVRDYSQIASREPLAVYLWEHYFVYAIPLGVAKRMNAISRIRINGEEDSFASSFLYTSTFWNSYDEWTSSIKGAIDSGSFTGGGGGFSLGGGGGGGGGGRGAF